jgi:hypothetical protein
MAEHTPYQRRVIRNYYQNQQAIMLQRLGDLVTDLYLAEGKRRAQLWKRAAAAMEKLKVSAGRVRHILQSDNPSLVAEVIKELLKKLN